MEDHRLMATVSGMDGYVYAGMMSAILSILMTLGRELTGPPNDAPQSGMDADEWTSSNGRPIPADTQDNSPAMSPLSGHPTPWHLEVSGPCSRGQMIRSLPANVSHRVAQSVRSHEMLTAEATFTSPY